MVGIVSHTVRYSILSPHLAQATTDVSLCTHLTLLMISAGNCKYTVHEDDVQWDAAKDVWDGLPPREKDR